MALRVASALAGLALAEALAGQQAQELHKRGHTGARADRADAFGATRTDRSGACDCMNWAEVYYNKHASCGRAKELYFLSKYGFSAAYAATEPITGLPHKVCNDFFKNFKDESCVNVDLYPFPRDNMSDKQWCYVSNDCNDLNGGEYATNQVGFAQGGWNNLASTSTLSWKICDPSVDSILKYKSVGELVDLGQLSDVSLSRLLRLAYPAVNITWGEAMYIMEAIDEAWAPRVTLAEVVDSLQAPTSAWGSRAVDVHSMLSDIVKSEQGTILDSPGHGDNFHVIRGREVWVVQRIALGDMAYLGGHFATEFDVNCTIGCAPVRWEAPSPVDLETL
ncbi:unnamed protein product [Prorocentrum cordatum]|uniref:Uncharacterized protein n=1 Tax=Prorocentrum cordatum TaxID=2364126 RepID=A0ABN9WG11_9DINO|nr:unnamed protein product [Polarella glacialis]